MDKWKYVLYTYSKENETKPNGQTKGYLSTDTTISRARTRRDMTHSVDVKLKTKIHL